MNTDLSIIMEMLLTIESRINTLVEFEIKNDELELFNEATQINRDVNFLSLSSC